MTTQATTIRHTPRKHSWYRKQTPGFGVNPWLRAFVMSAAFHFAYFCFSATCKTTWLTMTSIPQLLVGMISLSLSSTLVHLGTSPPQLPNHTHTHTHNSLSSSSTLSSFRSTSGGRALSSKNCFNTSKNILAA